MGAHYEGNERCKRGSIATSKTQSNGGQPMVTAEDGKRSWLRREEEDAELPVRRGVTWEGNDSRKCHVDSGFSGLPDAGAVTVAQRSAVSIQARAT